MTREKIRVAALKHQAQGNSMKPTQKALRECAEWLAYCVRIGWSKSALNDLEKLWWKYHDCRGFLQTKGENK